MKTSDAHKVYKNVFDVFRKTWANEGLRGLQRGLGPAVSVGGLHCWGCCELHRCGWCVAALTPDNCFSCVVVESCSRRSMPTK